MKDIINDLKRSDTWKIQLTIAINFVSSKDNDGEHAMHSTSDDIDIMINYKADEVFENLLNNFLIDLKLDWKHQ